MVTAPGGGDQLPVIRNLDTGEVIQLDEADALWKPRQSSRAGLDAGRSPHSSVGDAAGSPFLMSGHLWKRGLAIPPWTKRWFGVCADGYIYYYLGPSDAQPKGTIPVHGAVAQPLGEQEHAGQGYHGLAIVVNNKKRVLYAPTREELRDWIEAINAASGAMRGREPDMRLPASGAGAGHSSGSSPSSRRSRARAPAESAAHGAPEGSAQVESAGGSGEADARAAEGADGACSDGSWELDEDGYRVRRKKLAPAAGGGGGGGGRRRGRGRDAEEDGELGVRGGESDDEHRSGGRGDGEDEGEEDEEFRPAFQIKIRSAQEAREGTADDLKSAAAAFKMSAPLPPPQGRSRRVPGASAAPAPPPPAAAEPEPFAADWGSAPLAFPTPSATADAAPRRDDGALARASAGGGGGSGDAFGGSPADGSPEAQPASPPARPRSSPPAASAGRGSAERRRRGGGAADGGRARADANDHSERAAQPSASASASEGQAAPAPVEGVQLIQRAFRALEAARFDEALARIGECLALLTRSAAVRQRISDIRFCAQYHVALCLLIELARLEGRGEGGPDGARASARARLSALLAALPLLPPHRKVCLHMAVRCNLDAHNFGMAATFADALLAPGLFGLLAPQHAHQLRSLRAKCEGAGLRDGHSVRTPCWQCGASTRVTASECAECGTKVHVCCASHKVLQSDDFTWCPLCMCLFAPDVVRASDNCRVCGTGIVIAAGRRAANTAAPDGATTGSQSRGS